MKTYIQTKYVEFMYLGVCIYVCVYVCKYVCVCARVCMYLTTTKRPSIFKKNKKWVYGRVLKEEREEQNDVIILYTQKIVFRKKERSVPLKCI